MAAIIKLLIAGVLLLVYLCIEVLSHFSGQEILGIILCCVAVVVFFLSSNGEQKKEEYRDLSTKKTEYSDTLEKADKDYVFLQTMLLRIKDRELYLLLKELQQIAGKLLSYLKRHPERISAAMKFVNYYQDRTAVLVRQYLSLSETGLQTEEQQNLICEMRRTLGGFVAAYKKQFAKVMEHEMLHMEAEMKVARQVMDEEGICTKDNTPTATKVEKEEKKTEKGQEGTVTFKQVGIALATIIGAVGIYKFMDKNKEE